VGSAGIFAQAAEDVFHVDDRVVHHFAEGDGEAAEREGVEGDPEAVERDDAPRAAKAEWR
jgi:hypothetical protein